MLETKTLVKICGITSIEQAVQVAELGTNAIGIISVHESPRYISPEKKKEIFKTLKDLYPNIYRVSVVKNSPIDSIIEGFLGEPNENIIQLHGDEDQNFISEVKSNFKKKIYKSISPEDFKTTELVDVDQFLIEAKPSSNQMPGGNNTTWDWSDFKNIKKLPYILSGGLNVTNIKKAISLTGADFVDINSGVEEQPGEKSLTLIDGIISSIYN